MHSAECNMGNIFGVSNILRLVSRAFSKIWEISKIFVNIAQDYCAAPSLLLALKLDRAILFLRHFTILLPFTSILCKNRSYLPCHTQELNILNKNMLKLKI